MLHCGDGIIGVMRGVGFEPDIAFSLKAKKLNFSLICEYLLPYVWGVSHMPFGEHQTCLLIFFRKQWLFSSHSSVSPALWSIRLKVVLWTDNPISAVELCSSFRVIFGLFVSSLINALLAWSVSFGGRPSLGRFIVVQYYFHLLIMDLMVRRGRFKVLDILHNFVPDLFGELLGLHGAAC